MGWPPSSGVGIRTQRSSKQAAWLAQSQAAFCFIPYAWQTDLGPAFRTPDSELRNSSIPPGSGPRTERGSIYGRWQAREGRARLSHPTGCGERDQDGPQEGAAHHGEVRHRAGEEAQEAPRPNRPGRRARNPAVHVPADLLPGRCMHRELLGTDEGADGRHGASPSEEAIAPAGRHTGCCSDHRGAGASRMADPHGACRKARCLAVCGDWGPPQQQDSACCCLAAEKLEHLSSYKLPVSLCMGGNDERAAFQMSQDEGGSLLMCSFVERGKRLIEKHKP